MTGSQKEASLTKHGSKSKEEPQFSLSYTSFLIETIS